MKDSAKELKIIKVAREQGCYRVYYDEEGTLKQHVLTEEQILANRIIANKIFSPTDWQKIISESAFYTGLNRAINYLGYKMRSTLEVGYYLRGKGYDDEVSESIIEELKEKKLINDQRFAQSFFENYCYNLKGPLFIRYQLEQKGINQTLINEQIERYSPDLEVDNIKKVLEKEQLRLRAYPVNKQKELIVQKLRRDGFSFGLIMQVVNESEFSNNSFGQLEKDYRNLAAKTQDKAKIIQKLLQKGYSYADIKQVVNSEDNMS